MRCNNCGWTNAGDRTRCEKCNAPLKGSMIANHPEQQNQNQEAVGPLSGTLKGGVPDLPFLDKPESHSPNNDVTNCANCGYPDIPIGINQCPRCHQLLISGGKRRVGMGIGGTIDPYVKQNQVHCGLKPIPRDGETPPPVKEFSGTLIELNRDNLDPPNNSITSKVQATLTNINGRWYIEDQSALKTTYKHIEGTVELKNGDIIIMGDRKFVFSC